MRPGLGLYLIVSLALAVIVFSASRLSQRVWRYFSFLDIFRVVSVVGLVVLLAWSLTFLINRSDMIPRAVPILHWVIASGLLCGARAFARLVFAPERSKAFPMQGSDARSVLVVGTEDLAELYLRCVRRLGAGRVHVAGILDENTTMQGRVLSGVSVLGQPVGISDIVNAQAVHGVEIDRIIVATRFTELTEASREALRAFEKRSGQSLEFFEERLGFNFEPVAAQAQAAPYRTFEAPTRVIYPKVKRIIDIVGSAALIAILSPLIAMVWIMTLVDFGSPAYFWQVRPGRSGRPFRVLKFRTMRGAHDVQGNRIPDADRTSPVGEAFRNYRLDELPQLFNILKGDMSFIGPRPLLPVDQPTFMDLRLSVRPGLSGWAQINGGRDLPKEDKAALDAWYVNNMSFALDVEIVFRTIKFLISGEKPPEHKILFEARQCVRQMRSNGLGGTVANSAGS